MTEFAEAYGRPGAITDDTQMTLFTAEGLIRAYVRRVNKGMCDVPERRRPRVRALVGDPGRAQPALDPGGSGWVADHCSRPA